MILGLFFAILIPAWSTIVGMEIATQEVPNLQRMITKTGKESPLVRKEKGMRVGLIAGRLVALKKNSNDYAYADRLVNTALEGTKTIGELFVKISELDKDGADTDEKRALFFLAFFFKTNEHTASLDALLGLCANTTSDECDQLIACYTKLTTLVDLEYFVLEYLRTILTQAVRGKNAEQKRLRAVFKEKKDFAGLHSQLGLLKDTDLLNASKEYITDIRQASLSNTVSYQFGRDWLHGCAEEAILAELESTIDQIQNDTERNDHHEWLSTIIITKTGKELLKKLLLKENSKIWSKIYQGALPKRIIATVKELIEKETEAFQESCHKQAALFYKAYQKMSDLGESFFEKLRKNNKAKNKAYSETPLTGITPEQPTDPLPKPNTSAALQDLPQMGDQNKRAASLSEQENAIKQTITIEKNQDIKKYTLSHQSLAKPLMYTTGMATIALCWYHWSSLKAFATTYLPESLTRLLMRYRRASA